MTTVTTPHPMSRPQEHTRKTSLTRDIVMVQNTPHDMVASSTRRGTHLTQLERVISTAAVSSPSACAGKLTAC